MQKKIESKIKLTFWQFLLRLRDTYKPFLGVLSLIIFLMIIQEGLNLATPYIYGKIIDAIFQGVEINQVLFLCFLSLGVFLLNNVAINFLRERLEIQKFEFDVPRVVAEKTLTKVFSFSIGQHENQNSGINKSIIDKGQNSLVELASLSIYQIIPTIIQVIVTVVMLLIIAPVLGLIVFSGVFIFILLIVYANKALDSEYNNVRDMWTQSDKEQSEFLRNVSLVKINAKEKRSIEEYTGNFLNINTYEKNLWMKFIYYSNSREIVSVITRILTIIVGVYLVYDGVYTPGFLVVAFSWSNNAFNRVGWLSGILRRTTMLYSRIQNYFILVDIEPDIKEKKNPIVVDRFEGKIEYRNVFFKYRERDVVDSEGSCRKVAIKKSRSNVLKNINILIKPRQRVAIVGHSGAGKSTLIQLLIRAYDPLKGKILIDGNDLKDLSLENYRQSLGVVPQDVSLFDNTLRYNILFGTNKEVSDQELEEVLIMARMDGFLKNLENGLDTIIGERGVKLSGGERQRVGIARALVKNPSFLIFDEATSSLDAENEALIKDSIEKASRGRTTIIIAHRLSTIKDADKIIVLNDGIVVSEGTHSYLLRECEYYKKMISFQTVIVGGN